MNSKFKVKRWLGYAAIALLSATTATLLVADNELPFKPGLWEFTSTAESATAGAAGTEVDTQCITDDLLDVEKMTSALEQSMPGAMCEIERNTTGNQFDVKMICSGGGADMQGEGSYTVGNGGLSMEGEMTLKLELAGNPVEVKTIATGKWVGEC